MKFVFAAFALWILIMIALPIFTTSPFILRVLTFAMLTALFAASWDIIGGYSGQPNFGHAAFWGIGAYTAGFIASGTPGIFGIQPFFRLSPWLAILVAPIIATFFAILVGFLCVRKRGPYTAIITLMISIILGRIVLLYPEIFGAEEGLSGIESLSFDYIANYQITVTLSIISISLLYLIGHSRLGLTLKAVRDDEDASEALGIDVARYKILAFAIGGLFAGFAGGLHSVYMHHVGPMDLDMTLSANVLWYSIIGGLGTIVGPVAGALILRLSLEVLIELREIHILIMNAIIIAIMLFYSEGLVKAFREIGLYGWFHGIWETIQGTFARGEGKPK
jgi:branched-chain amino acid transport system permease protein